MHEACLWVTDDTFEFPTYVQCFIRDYVISDFTFAQLVSMSLSVDLRLLQHLPKAPKDMV